MCGISGYIGPNFIDNYTINRTLSLMKSRGPDNQDSYENYTKEKNLNNVYLLHSRLSILDLDKRSNQPFLKENLVIIFNGEIYNYIEIRTKLIKLDHKFKTLSDTEVILEAFKRYGESCVKFFEGMWAFVIFDIKNNKIFCSRDRFGEKPFFYFFQNGSFYFGSEPKFIFSLMNKRMKPNLHKIKSGMYNGFRSLFKKRESFFENLKELEPSSNLEINCKMNIDIKKYWRLYYSPKKDSLRNIQENIKYLINKSVKIRLRSDVPIAFCLSGGIDSSTLVSIAKKNGVDVKTFSIIDSDERYNESENINLLVDFLDLDHVNIKTSPDNFLERMYNQTKYFESPIPTISYYVHNFLTEKMKKNGFSVSISGTGADEIFTGYYDHYSYWLYSMKNNKNFDFLLNQWENSYGKHINNPLIKNISNFLNNPGYRKHLYQDRSQYASLFNFDFDDFFEEEFYTPDVLRNRMINELSSEVVPVILFSDDLNSMMYSIENRSPFLDQSLIEYVYTIPNEFLIMDGYPKWLLRNLDKDLLPETVKNDKRKRGFNTSINSLLDKSNKEIYDWIFKDSQIFELIHKENFKEFISKDLKANDSSKFFFNFISNKIFLEQNS